MAMGARVLPAQFSTVLSSIETCRETLLFSDVL
jgi:hypothetical protein